MKRLALEQKRDLLAIENFRNLVSSFRARLTPTQAAVMDYHARHGTGLILPLVSDQDDENIPWTTVGLILTNLVIFRYTAYDDLVLRVFGLTPATLWEKGEWSQLFTSQYLHGGILHLVGNCYFL